MTEAPTLDAADWQELAERLIYHPYPGGPASQAQVFSRRLPNEFAEMPLPSDAHLLGGALHAHGDGRPAYLEAILDAPASGAELVRSYRAELLAAGWSDFEVPRPMHAGFVSGVAGDSQTFRRGDTGPALMVTAVDREGRPADVRVRLDWELPRRMPHPGHGLPPGADRMPALRPGPGVDLSGQTGGGGEDGWTSTASAVTELPAARLEGYLSDQLADSGWTRVRGSADDAVAWSSWHLPGGEEWRGLLLVLGAFSSGRSTLMLRIERDSDSDRSGGMGYSVTG